MGQFKTIVFIDVCLRWLSDGALHVAQNAYRANFGFIYKPLSKAIFIILCVLQNETSDA